MKPLMEFWKVWSDKHDCHAVATEFPSKAEAEAERDRMIEKYSDLKGVDDFQLSVRRVAALPASLIVTSAPIAYDGFGTRELMQYTADEPVGQKTYRLVLVQDQHKEWQMGRYWSGMHSCIALEAKMDALA